MDIQPTSDQKLSRRSVFRKGGALGVAAATGALVLPELASATDGKHHGKRLRLTVMNACFNSGPSEFDMPPPEKDIGQTGLWVNNFVVVGDIVSVDGNALKAPGKYYCKGVIFPLSNLAAGTDKEPCAAPAGDTFVDQQFRIPGMGSLLGMGTEGTDPALGLNFIENGGDELGVVGGTGEFIGARGNYSALVIDDEGPRPFARSGVIHFEFNLFRLAKRHRRHRRRWWEHRNGKGVYEEDDD